MSRPFIVHYIRPYKNGNVIPKRMFRNVSNTDSESFRSPDSILRNFTNLCEILTQTFSESIFRLNVHTKISLNAFLQTCCFCIQKSFIKENTDFPLLTVRASFKTSYECHSYFGYTIELNKIDCC